MTAPIRLLALLVCVGTIAGCSARNAEIEDDGLTIHNPHHGLWQDRNEVPVRFELEQVFGADEEPVDAILGGVQHSLVDADGNVYLFDPTSSRLVGFAPDGSVRWSTGQEGQGPGEFQRVRGLVWNGLDQLYVLNQSGNLLETYGTDGVHRGGVSVDLDSLNFPGLVGFVQPDLFVFETFAPSGLGTRLVLARRGDSWKQVGSIEEDQSQSAPVVEHIYSGPDVRVIGEKIIVGHISQYRFATYDTTGSLVRVIRRDMHDLVRPGRFQKNGMRAIGTFSQLGPFLRLRSGHALAYAGWAANIDDPDEAIKSMVESDDAITPEWVHEIDVYDAMDRLLYTIPGDGYFPEIGHPEFVDAAGRLYTSVHEPYPQLRRYRVVIDE